MKVRNPSGREYYIQRAKDDRMANWCSRVTPVVLEFDGVPAQAFADPDRSDWIYICFNDTTYCHWAKEAGGFDILNEIDLQISDPGRTYRKRMKTSHENENKDRSSSKGGEDRPALTREDLDAVVTYLPELRDSLAARNADPATVSHEYSNNFRTVVRKIVKEFHTRQFMYAFDYLSWMDEGRRLMEDVEAVAELDFETIRKLLVVHWRSDYWDTDNEHWEHVAATGHLTSLLERLAAIAEGMQPAGSTPQVAEKYVWGQDDGSNIWKPRDSRRPMMLSELQAAAEWLPQLVDAIKRERSNISNSEREPTGPDLQSFIEKMVDHFDLLSVFVEIDLDSWSQKADVYVNDLDEISAADLFTLRCLLSYHQHRISEDGYWEHLALSGHLTRILRRFDELYRRSAAVTPVGVSESHDSDSTAHVEEANSLNAWAIDDPGELLENIGVEGVDGFVPPSFSEYVRAFHDISENLTEKQKLMLKAHFHSGGRAVTMRELAKASGYDDYKIANIQYGSLGKRVIVALGRETPLHQKQPLALLVLGSIVDRKAFGLEMHCVMHKPLADALEEMNLV